MCIDVAYMNVCAPCVCLVFEEPEGGHWIPWTWNYRGYELPYGH